VRVLSDKTAREWLSERGVQVDASGRLSFQTTQQVTELRLSPPATREAVTALAVNVVGILNTELGWLLWLKDFSIWSDDTEELGWNIIDTFARIAQQPELNTDSSAMLYEPDETLSLKTTLVVPILFQWDAYLVNGDGNTFVRLDHDDHSSISTRKPSVVKEIQDSQLRPSILSVT